MPAVAVNMADFHEPSVEDIDAARVAARQLSKVSPRAPMISFSVVAKDGDKTPEPISLPQNIFKTVIDLLIQIGNGNAVQIVPIQAELTTQQAADLLNVSRPHLIKLLNQGDIKFRMVGTHRKVPAKCLFEYRDKTSVVRREALTRMVALDEEDGLYDDGPLEPREP